MSTGDNSSLKKFPGASLRFFKLLQHITENNIRSFCSINAGMEPALLVIVHQRWSLLMISCQAFLQSNLIIIRPTDQRLTSNLGTKAHLGFIWTLMALIDLTDGIKGTNVVCIKLHKVLVKYQLMPITELKTYIILHWFLGWVKFSVISSSTRLVKQPESDDNILWERSIVHWSGN